MARIAINGFGRIGRLVARVWAENIEKYSTERIGSFDIAAINAAGTTGTMTPADVRYALKYDSNYGPLGGFFYYGTMKNDPIITCESHDNLMISGKRIIKILGENNPEKLPWRDLDIDIVVDCTGEFVKKSEAEKHLQAGAKKVIVSAPFKDIKEAEIIPHVVMGVNEQIYDPEKHNLISCASCTTNALAPMLLPLEEKFGIRKGLMSTIHAFTADQRLVDSKHKDIRRSRRALDNIILTSTGAANTIHLIIPSLKNGSLEEAMVRMDGVSLRIPIPTCSIIDLVIELRKNPEPEEILDIYRKYAVGALHNILAVIEDPIVSLDFLKSPYAVGIDRKIIMSGAKKSRLYKIFGYYDNEWGYAEQLMRLIKYVSWR